MLKYLRVFKLYIKFFKCWFNSSEISFLSFHININNVLIKSNWIIIITNWSISEFFNKMQVFLKFANFYHYFIKNYLWVIYHLINLLKNFVKKQKIRFFQWIEKVKKIFQKLKTHFMIVFILYYFLLLHQSLILRQNALS